MHCEQCILRNVEGSDICVVCGLTRIRLEPSVCSFSEQHTHQNRAYSRKKRFMRLFLNLQGRQNISADIMEKIPKHCKTPGELSLELRNIQSLRSYRSKLPSIWYQLGHKWEPFSEAQIAKASIIFSQVHSKVSFLILLPWICAQIGREDMCKFCKPISPALYKKYEHVLANRKK